MWERYELLLPIEAHLNYLSIYIPIYDIAHLFYLSIYLPMKYRSLLNANIIVYCPQLIFNRARDACV
jgi:hypothetical protein